MAITEMLRDTGRATATINTYLAALKGVAKEAWMLRLMDVDSFQHIRAVRNLRGSRLPRGRALPAAEIRQLLPHVMPIAAVWVRGTRPCWR
nr:Uncharacterised protein [Escherichia coli]